LDVFLYFYYFFFAPDGVPALTAGVEGHESQGDEDQEGDDETQPRRSPYDCQPLPVSASCRTSAQL